jgi:hypothetical protein
VTKQDAVWAAIRVIGIYMLVHAVVQLPSVFAALASGSDIFSVVTITMILYAAIGWYLMRGGGALYRWACSEQHDARH